jgi:predicted O-methyltransferase YrrM
MRSHGGAMLKINESIEVIEPTNEENKVLYALDGFYEKYSQMTKHEKEYINAIVLRNKPKKLLEIGVSAGSSTILLLNAINKDKNAKLFSIDYSKDWYKSSDKKTGFLLDNYVNLKQKWELYTGGLSIKFMDKIGENIDFCLIDTQHIVPGGILDFLMVFPFLTDNAIIILHDINLYTCNLSELQWDIPNSLLMSTIIGKKYIQGNFSKTDENKGKRTNFPNIGGIKLSQKSRQNIYELLNLLTMKWAYLPSKKEQNEILLFFKNHYEDFYYKFLKEIFDYQNKRHSTTG